MLGGKTFIPASLITQPHRYNIPNDEPGDQIWRKISDYVIWDQSKSRYVKPLDVTAEPHLLQGMLLPTIAGYSPMPISVVVSQYTIDYGGGTGTELDMKVSAQLKILLLSAIYDITLLPSAVLSNTFIDLTVAFNTCILLITAISLPINRAYGWRH